MGFRADFIIITLVGRLLIISFDAVADSVWKSAPDSCRNIKAFTSSAETFTGVRSIFLSNTYPIHCSVATGKPPKEHGVLNNVAPFPGPIPKWTISASAIKVRTIWQAAAEAGLKVATFLWPCTGGSPHIRWNIPEIPPVPGQKQIAANLKEGSKLLQLGVILRHGDLVRRITPATVDELTTVCAADVLRRKKPDLTLVHLTRSDSLGHELGPGPETSALIYEAMDKSLGVLLDAAGGETEVIAFSDHGCKAVHTEPAPNDLLKDMGLFGEDCFFECCGGSVFLHAGALPEPKLLAVREKAEDLEGFSRFLTDDEMSESGRKGLPFGFGFLPGYSAEPLPTGHKGNHGYPLDVPDYNVFYAIRGRGFSPGAARTGGSLLDIAPIAASLLGVDMKQERSAK